MNKWDRITLFAKKRGCQQLVCVPRLFVCVYMLYACPTFLYKRPSCMSFQDTYPVHARTQPGANAQHQRTRRGHRVPGQCQIPGHTHGGHVEFHSENGRMCIA